MAQKLARKATSNVRIATKQPQKPATKPKGQFLEVSGNDRPSVPFPAISAAQLLRAARPLDSILRAKEQNPLEPSLSASTSIPKKGSGNTTICLLEGNPTTNAPAITVTGAHDEAPMMCRYTWALAGLSEEVRRSEIVSVSLRRRIGWKRRLEKKHPATREKMERARRLSEGFEVGMGELEAIKDWRRECLERE